MTKKGRDSGNREDDAALWHQVTRGVRAYDSRKKPAPKSDAKPVLKKPAAPRPISLPPVTPHVPAKGFDRATETKMRRGKLPIEGELDMHGMTQAEAHAALHRFIARAIVQEKRTVLVITGKGKVGGGVLKQKLPQWLEDPALARYIVAVTPAHIKDGGGGAFYVRLKKPGISKG